jgi:SH3-like domain-containing protein
VGTPRSMSVQIKSAQVRATPSFLGRVLAEVAYAQQVVVQEDRGDWMHVSVPGKGVEGWLHGSALSAKRIVLKAGAEDVQQAAGGGEIALAGKGFNEQVEKEYRARNAEVDFTWVDRMETKKPDTARIKHFAEQGNLKL